MSEVPAYGFSSIVSRSPLEATRESSPVTSGEITRTLAPAVWSASAFLVPTAPPPTTSTEI